MAKGKGTKKVSMSAEEQAAQAALDKFSKAHEGKTLTDAQKKEKKELQRALGVLRFVRIANKRVPRAVAAVEGIANLGAASYVKSDAQVKAIVARLKAAVTVVENALSGAKATSESFTVPGFEDAKE